MIDDDDFPARPGSRGLRGLPELPQLRDGWPALEPAPGFADRVMARLPPRLQLVSATAVIDRAVGNELVSEYSLINSWATGESLKRQAARGGFLFAAVAAAALVILPFTLHRRAPSAHASVVAVGVAPDLGLERD